MRSQNPKSVMDKLVRVYQVILSITMASTNIDKAILRAKTKPKQKDDNFNIP